MSNEENEDSAVRGLLGTAFADPEPPLRDLASGSIARGDAVRRRNRMFAAGGAALSAVAVVGTFAVVSGTTPAKSGTPSPANQVTSAATSASPTGSLGFGRGGAVALAFDKVQDIEHHLPALLQPLLPSGITAGRMPPNTLDVAAPAGSVLLTGPSGTNQVETWVGSAPDRTELIDQVACPFKGTGCHVSTIAGGTVYVDSASATAVDVVKGAGLKADVVKAGTGDTVVSKTMTVTFVPIDHSKYAFNFTVTTSTANVQYADHEPSDYMTGGLWPPRLVTEIAAHDASGLMVSADDVVAMLGKPELTKVESLLDPRIAVSQDTKTRIADGESQVAAAAVPGLPTTVKVNVDTTSLEPQPQIVVTGPTGKNVLTWDADNQTAQYRQQTLGWTPPNVTATKRTVPGGTLLVWAEKPMDSSGTILGSTPSSYQYWLFPDDTSKPALTMTLSTDATSTGTPGRSITDPGHTYSVSDGPYAPVQVSADQFLAAAQSGHLATAIADTKSLLAALSS